LEEQQRKLQDELQKKADEARKKLESQQPSAAAPK
ncbi:MAG: invasion associated locus B family protein, partial [Rhizobiales bacterium]|nr:invasion associated locus B family protein [Hyphomicrobiales bacterium]